MQKAMVWTDSTSAEPAVAEAAELSRAHGAELVVLLLPPRDLSAEEASSAIEVAEELVRTYDGKLIVVDRETVPDIHEVLAPESAPDDGDGEPSLPAGMAVVGPGSKDPVGAAIRAAQEEKADVMVRPQVVDGDAGGLDSGRSGSSRSVPSEAVVSPRGFGPNGSDCTGPRCSTTRRDGADRQQSVTRLYLLESAAIDLMRRYSLLMLRLALGTIFVWFGALKIFDVSPVADLVATSLSMMPPRLAVTATGVVELAIGLGLLTGRFPRLTMTLFFGLMIGTFLPLVAHPMVGFQDGNPLLLSVIGEFIFKNIILITAGFTIVGSIRQRMEPADDTTGVDSYRRPRVSPSRERTAAGVRPRPSTWVTRRRRSRGEAPPPAESIIDSRDD